MRRAIVGDTAKLRVGDCGPEHTDPYVTLSEVERFEAALRGQGTVIERVDYDATHGFFAWNSRTYSHRPKRRVRGRTRYAFSAVTPVGHSRLAHWLPNEGVKSSIVRRRPRCTSFTECSREVWLVENGDLDRRRRFFRPGLWGNGPPARAP